MNRMTQFKARVLPLMATFVVGFVLLPLAQAKQPSEDRGNGNSAAEDVDALNLQTTGSNNTAHGWFSLFSNTTGSFNTANGVAALNSNTTGSNNTAVGIQALLTNSTGSRNTAVGDNALSFNGEGSVNTAMGENALSGAVGDGNTAVGAEAGGLLPHDGNFNTAIGLLALSFLSSGDNNVAVGNRAGEDLSTGSGNVYIGANVNGAAGESNTTRIRNVYTSIVTARPVYVDSDNKIGTLSSSRRFKEKIQPMGKTSETLFALKPVSFRYKKEIDHVQALSFGLIAEEVAQINPDLITRDGEGKPQTVRYEAVNAMLLNEFLKEHRKNEEQGARIAELKKEIARLAARDEEQATQIQKMSAQLELSKAASQTVLNDQ